jgi:hypothetical protein
MSDAGRLRHGYGRRTLVATRPGAEGNQCVVAAITLFADADPGDHVGRPAGVEAAT